MDLLANMLATFLVTAALAAPGAPAAPQLYSGYGSDSFYTADFEDDLGGPTYTAVPLHRPLPVLRVLSHSPHTFDSPLDVDLELVRHYHGDRPLPSAFIGESRVREPTLSASEPQLEVIYARPNKRGGYSYRRPAAAAATAAAATPVPRAPGAPAPHAPRNPPAVPVIIHVHKYKIIRTR